MIVNTLRIPPWCGGWDIARYCQRDQEEEGAEDTTNNSKIFPPSSGKGICQSLRIGPGSHVGEVRYRNEGGRNGRVDSGMAAYLTTNV